MGNAFAGKGVAVSGGSRGVGAAFSARVATVVPAASSRANRDLAAGEIARGGGATPGVH